MHAARKGSGVGVGGGYKGLEVGGQAARALNTKSAAQALPAVSLAAGLPGRALLPHGLPRHVLHTHSGRLPAASRPQKRNLGPAAQALEAPAEWEDGLLVDPDVQQETDKMRGRARRYVGAGFDSSAGALSEAEGELVGGAAAARDAGGAAPAAVPAAGEGRRVIHLEASCVGPPTAPAPLAPAVAGSPPAGQHPSKEGLQGTASGAAQRQYAVEMYGMRKVYRRRGSLLRSRPFVAVRGNWLGIYEGGFRGWQATGIAAVPAAGHSAAGLGLPLLRMPKSWAGCACVPACTLRH